MSIIRSEHNKQNPYVMMNKHALEDSAISLQAKGLWAYLISRPTDWRISVIHLAKTHNVSKNRIYSILSELIMVGYCKKEQKKSGNKYLPVEYVIFETKKEIQIILPLLQNEKPQIEDAQKSTLQNKDLGLKNEAKEVVCSAEAVVPPTASSGAVASATPSAKQEQAPSASASPSTKLKTADLQPIPAVPPDHVLATCSKTHPDGSSCVISLEDVYRHAVMSKMDWSAQEIASAWQILCDYQGPVRTWKRFIEGTIENLRNAKKYAPITKKTQDAKCKTPKSQDLNSSLPIEKPKSSEPVTLIPAFQRLILDIKNKRCSQNS